MPGATQPGYKGRLFYGTAGSTATNQLTNCTNLDYDTAASRAPTTVRGNGSAPPTETSIVVSIKPTITWTMLNKPNDTILAALRAAAATGAAVALRTKDHASGKGFDGDCNLSVKTGMPIDGVGSFEFTAEATDDEGRDPQLYV